MSVESQEHRWEQRMLSILSGTANGIAYVVFALIGLAILAFFARWAIDAYWMQTHCTQVIGTTVCK